MADNVFGYKSKRQFLEILRGQLENERTSFLSHWRDIGDYILPRRPRFAVSDVNKGDRRNSKIIDSTATMAARTLRSGMMSGVTSPARPWFRLTTPDPDLAEFGPVKEWLHIVERRITTSFLRSNLYNVLPVVYGDIGAFGTSAMYIEEDFTGDVIRCYPFPIGSYFIAQDEKLKVNTFMRDFRMTVNQLVSKFGQTGKPGEINWDIFSQQVRNYWENGQRESWIDVCHAIRPNENYDPNKLESKYKKYYSCYFERSSANSSGNTYDLNSDKFLKEEGYDYFPVLCPRWETTGEDIYGTDCPGMISLGDVKQMQLGERKIMQAIEKMINPPMIGPTSLRTQKASILPADITYVDEREGQKGFRPAHEINFRINELEQKQQQCRQRISRSFFEDLFLMLAQSDRRDITAREIEERHEEKLLALGPVLEQLNQDLLDPLIDIAFNIHVKQKLLPPPPEELQGQDLKVEYISIMAQAQKLVGIAGVERFVGFVGQMAQFDPGVLDKVKTDQVVDVYADMTSVPPSIVRTDEDTEDLRAQKAQAVQAQQKMEMMAQGAQTAKDLSQAKLGENSALDQLAGAAGISV